jgi:hypothetical protein
MYLTFPLGLTMATLRMILSRNKSTASDLSGLNKSSIDVNFSSAALA